MNSKRIRDRFFPEGGKIRHYLRILNRIGKSIFNIKFWKEQKQKVKEKGMKETLHGKFNR